LSVPPLEVCRRIIAWALAWGRGVVVPPMKHPHSDQASWRSGGLLTKNAVLLPM
jgi:hypothetical protein